MQSIWIPDYDMGSVRRTMVARGFDEVVAKKGKNFARLCGMLVVRKVLVIKLEVDASMSTYLSRSCTRQH